MNLEKIKDLPNIADKLDKQKLIEIGQTVIKGYQIDEDSRAKWKVRCDRAMEIAQQTLETKDTPFPNSSNVKFPLITQAAIDFASRTYPEIVQSDKVLRMATCGRDPDGRKMRQAGRLSDFLNYDLIKTNYEWKDGLDRMLHVYPVVGIIFRKTYEDLIRNRIVSDLCTPDKVVVNYGTKSLESARRITHIISLTFNEVIERINAGIFSEVDLSILNPNMNADDSDPEIEFLEQHCYIDLDDDDYKEPYIAVVHKLSGTVMRIAARIKEIIYVNDHSKKIKTIIPEHYFTDYHFIRSPDGGFYSLGLGTLLYPLNASINTLINQLIDTGTINNLGGGFIGQGLRIKNGEFKFRLGEWKVVNTDGLNLQQNVVPLPGREPSPTSFQLMELLIGIGKELIAAHDIMQGKGPTQNVPATTSMAMIQQGMKIFNAITKRLFAGLEKEFKRIFELYKVNVNPDYYKAVLDDPEADASVDFQTGTYDVTPVADPNISSEAQRMARVQVIMSIPGINQYELGQYMLNTLHMEQELIDKLLPPPDPNAPPAPDAQKLLAEAGLYQAQAQQILHDMQMKPAELELKGREISVKEAEAQSRIQTQQVQTAKTQTDALVSAAKVDQAEKKLAFKTHLDTAKLQQQQDKDHADAMIKATEVAQKPMLEKIKAESKQHDRSDQRE